MPVKSVIIKLCKDSIIHAPEAVGDEIEIEIQDDELSISQQIIDDCGIHQNWITIKAKDFDKIIKAVEGLNA